MHVYEDVLGVRVFRSQEWTLLEEDTKEGLKNTAVPNVSSNAS